MARPRDAGRCGLRLRSSLTHARRDAASLNVAEEWAFTGLGRSARIRVWTSAEAAYRTALTLDPQSSFAWDGLGLLLQRKAPGTKTSMRSFAKAVAINPSNATAWVHLGVARERLRDLPGAIDCVSIGASTSRLSEPKR